MKKLAVLVLAAIFEFVLSPMVLGAQVRLIDSAHSKLHVYVYKSGLFSALGDDHEIEAPISKGFVDESARHVEFSVDARRMTVLDPPLSPDKRQQVQERMLGPEVLDVSHFSEIRFESTSVEQAGPGRLLVRGQLELHGQKHPVVVSVQTENGHYVGTSTLKQRDFGITPISIAGGTVKVKDEVKIDFDIRTKTQAVEARPK